MKKSRSSKVMSAFICSGGGLRGCFQVGAIDYLVNTKKILPDLVCGISTGSLQALGLARGSGKDRVGLLLDTWSDLKKKKDVYFTPLRKFILEFPYILWDAVRSACAKSEINGNWFRGLHEFGGLKQFVNDEFESKPPTEEGIRLIAGAVDLKTGWLTYFDSHFETYFRKSSSVAKWLKEKQLRMGRLDCPKQIIASCSIPGFFPPVDIGAGQFVDGGARDIVPMKVAIHALKQMAEGKGVPDAELKLYLLLCDPLDLKKRKKSRNLLSVIYRTLDIVCNEIFLNDIESALKKNALVGKRSPFARSYSKVTVYAVKPRRPFIDVLEVDQKKIQDGMAHGRECAELGSTKPVKLDKYGNLVFPY